LTSKLKGLLSVSPSELLARQVYRPEMFLLTDCSTSVWLLRMTPVLALLWIGWPCTHIKTHPKTKYLFVVVTTLYSLFKFWPESWFSRVSCGLSPFLLTSILAVRSSRSRALFSTLFPLTHSYHRIIWRYLTQENQEINSGAGYKLKIIFRLRTMPRRRLENANVKFWALFSSRCRRRSVDDFTLWLRS
jgi:hypothetical protein